MKIEHKQPEPVKPDVVITFTAEEFGRFYDEIGQQQSPRDYILEFYTKLRSFLRSQ